MISKTMLLTFTFFVVHIKILPSFQKSNHMLNPITAFLLFFSCLISGFASAQEPDRLQLIDQRQSMIVGTLYGESSFQFKHDKPTGLEYILAKQFAQHLGVSLDIKPFVTEQALIQALDSGEIDIAASNLPLTGHYREKFKYSPPYKHVMPFLMSNSDNYLLSNIETIRQPIAVAKNSGLGFFLAQQSIKSPQLIWKEFADKSLMDLADLVSSGKYQHALIHSDQVDSLRKLYPRLTYLQLTQNPLPIAWLLSQHQDDRLPLVLLEFFGKINQNGSLTRFKQEAEHVENITPFYSTRSFIQATQHHLASYETWFKSYQGQLDWRLIAALSFQMSQWRDDAVFSGNRLGLMGISLGTAQDFNLNTRLSPQQNIQAGSGLLNRLYNHLPARIPSQERIWFAVAAYFIGLDHVEAARNLTLQQGANADIWLEVEQNFPLLEHMDYYADSPVGYAAGRDTVQFVKNVRKYFDTLIWLDEQPQE